MVMITNITTTKRCSLCGELKLISEFYDSKRARSGKRSSCKDCIHKKTHSSVGKFSKFRGRIKRKYGLTTVEYDAQLKLQSGVCAICGNLETSLQNGEVQRLGVDHNHLTGRFRGLLCTRCNTLLGMAGEDPHILQRAIQYLEELPYRDN